MSRQALREYESDQRGVVERFRSEIAGQELEKPRLLPAEFCRTSELLEASISRYRIISESMSENSIDQERLRRLMVEDPVVSPYLSAADGQCEKAFELAMADVNFWSCLRNSGWKTRAQQKATLARWLGRLLGAPLLLVCFTAIIGNYVATSLQDRAFREQRFFEAKFQRLKEGQQRSVMLLSRVIGAKESMTGWETWGGGIGPREVVDSLREELEQVRALAIGGEEKGSILSVTQRAKQDLENYLSCLQTKIDRPRSNSEKPMCSLKFELGNFEKLPLSFGEEIQALAVD